MQRRVGRLVRLTAGARFRSLLYTLAQLCFATGNYPLALEHMAEWVQRADDSGPRPHIFMGQVHLQLRDHPAALAHVQTGIRLAEERGVEVQDPWRKLEAYLQSVVENGDEAAAFQRTRQRMETPPVGRGTGSTCPPSRSRLSIHTARCAIASRATSTSLPRAK
jgi:hypothetical protein